MTPSSPPALDLLRHGPQRPSLVAASISREIAERRLGPGDRLPTEQALATMFGVSRNVVREAVARLSAAGLVKARQGSGVFVAAAPDAAILPLEPPPPAALAALGEIAELRSLLEIEAAGLAALRHRESDRTALDGCCRRLRAAPYGSRAWLDADLDFHRQVAEAAGNASLASMAASLSPQVRGMLLGAGTRRRPDIVAGETISEHAAILDAIFRRDAPAARRAMRRHLARAARRLGLHVA